MEELMDFIQLISCTSQEKPPKLRMIGVKDDTEPLKCSQ
jgi:hypothetical protein